MKFLQKMRLYFFYTMVQKKSKMTKNSNQGGSCLKIPRLHLGFLLRIYYAIIPQLRYVTSTSFIVFSYFIIIFFCSIVLFFTFGDFFSVPTLPFLTDGKCEVSHRLKGKKKIVAPAGSTVCFRSKLKMKKPAYVPFEIGVKFLLFNFSVGNGARTELKGDRIEGAYSANPCIDKATIYDSGIYHIYSVSDFNTGYALRKVRVKVQGRILCGALSRTRFSLNLQIFQSSHHISCLYFFIKWKKIVGLGVVFFFGGGGGWGVGQRLSFIVHFEFSLILVTLSCEFKFLFSQAFAICKSMPWSHVLVQF